MPIVPDDVSLNKAAIIERALRRAREEYALDPDFASNTHSDAMILNLERACQAAIDLAVHVIAAGHLGIPQTSSDAFLILRKAALISHETARNMVAMTGFRNIAIHEYQALDMSIVREIVEYRWRSLVVFCEELGLVIVP